MALENVIDTENVRRAAGALRELDWTPIDRRLSGKTGDTNYVTGLKEETLRFLAIAAAGDGNYAPSQKVDEYWHEMVLHTPLYARMTDRLGQCIHHRPSEQLEQESYTRTLSAYRAAFGEPNPRYWKQGDAADCDTQCNTNTCFTTGPDWLRAPKGP